jgi:hypothetical protein
VVLADLNPELNGLPLGIPAGVLRETTVGKTVPHALSFSKVRSNKEKAPREGPIQLTSWKSAQPLRRRGHRMRRRELLLFAAMLVGISPAAAQQPPAHARIGWLAHGDTMPRHFFDEALAQLGWVEGKRLSSSGTPFLAVETLVVG